jgi:hypothetical protein
MASLMCPAKPQTAGAASPVRKASIGIGLGRRSPLRRNTPWILLTAPWAHLSSRGRHGIRCHAATPPEWHGHCSDCAKRLRVASHAACRIACRTHHRANEVAMVRRGVSHAGQLKGSGEHYVDDKGDHLQLAETWRVMSPTHCGTSGRGSAKGSADAGIAPCVVLLSARNASLPGVTVHLT